MSPNQKRISYSHLTDLDKKKIVVDWKSSGLTQTAYCKQHDLSMGAFTYWNSKFKQELCDEKRPKTAFSSVKVINSIKANPPVPTQTIKTEAIEILMRDEYIIKIPVTVKMDFIAQILREIGGLYA